MGERLQHRGIRNNVSQVLRRVGFLLPPKSKISLHLEQIFFEQSFVIFDGFLASAEFCAIMKNGRIILTMFILSNRFFSLQFELSNVILRKWFRSSLYMKIFLSSGAIKTKWKTRWGAKFYFTVSSIIQNNSLRSWKLLHQYTLK